MAFTSTIVSRTVFGNKKIVIGTYDGGGDNGGDIATGLHICEILIPVPSTATGNTTVAETFPIAGSAVTVASGADIDGAFIAIGA